MESSTRQEIKVGLFAFIGLILFLLSIVLLGGDKFFFTRSYNLKVRLNQVQGLGRGSVVTLTGVQVGNVEEIRFIENSSDVEILLSIQSTVQSRITEGSRVTVKTQGALGDKYIYIEPGPHTSPALAPGSLLAVDTTPDLIDMISSKGAQLGEIVNVIKELHTLFANFNRDGRSAKLMNNLVETSEHLNGLAAEGRETMKVLRTQAILPFANVMKKIDNGQGTLGALINDPSLHNRLSSLLGETPRNRFLKPMIRESIQTNESQGK